MPRQRGVATVKDPCIKLCKFERDICRGCGRSKAEIKGWKKLGKEARRAVLAEADMRLLSLAAIGRKKS
ncbi:MAG: DUF1289 domain-containing protein [Pseudomonas sp.]|uniref:DUF1289 domain-containing protein n=1 Tax=Pseudomonas sp. TaxID=306 RepID=UPI00398271E8